MDMDKMDYLLSLLEETTGLSDKKAIRDAFDRLRFDIGAFADREEETRCAG
jgi:hypothetical protein